MENEMYTSKESVNFKDNFSFLKNKKAITIAVIALFLFILILSVWIRFGNMSLLKDPINSGEYIPADPDACYFLREAEAALSSGGFNKLSQYDPLRPTFNWPWYYEFLPRLLIGMYKIANVFGNYSLSFIDVIYPPIIFGFGLIVFFFLIYFLTKSKITALLSSIFLAFIPSYLFRTTAGVADHDPLGMLGFFLTLLIFTYCLNLLEKNFKENLKNKKQLIKLIGISLLLGIVTSFAMISGAGLGNYLFMIIPLVIFIFWSLESQKENNNLNKILIFYVIWIVSSVIITSVIAKDFKGIIDKFIFNALGLASLFVLGFIIVDLFLISKESILKLFNKRYRIFYTAILTLVLGFLFLFVIGKNPGSLISDLIERFIHPWGTERISLTVAENSQPYLSDWISDSGKIFFWMFIAGLIFIGLELGKYIESKKEKNIFIILYIFMFSGIVFSRISNSSLFNGINFISKLFYFIPILLFIYYFGKLYFNKKLKIDPSILILFIWAISMIVSARAAIRIFFILSPFVCFSGAFFLTKTFEYSKQNKDELVKFLLIIILILGIMGAIYSTYSFYNQSKIQAQYIGPAINNQWQKSMNWVKTETPQGAIFVHWWDYGYLVEYFGKRPAVSDGGHYQGEFQDHLIGRYLLTTPKPETALSYMKSHKVSYLLIDPSDIGKYGAYSKIGSNDKWDRFSYIGALISEKSQMRETASGTIRIYQGGIGVDEDIVYEENNSKIFIPGPTYDKIGQPEYKAYLGGIILETTETLNGLGLKQPEGVFIYNDQQIKIPIRYAYINGELKDFKNGINATFDIVPKIDNNNGQVSVDKLGAGMYLSPKVSEGLFSQLYLMNDPLNKYSTVKLAHSEDDQVVDILKSQNSNIGEFVYYGGIRGPLKIWKVEYPENIAINEEFLKNSGEYASLDNLNLER